MGRSPCCEKEPTNKGAWSREEDERLFSYIRENGEGNWRSLPKAAGLLRCGKSCRLRWINYLRPDIKRGNFTTQEEDLIVNLHSLVGNKWSLIASRLPGRTDNEIKNYWNTHIRRKLLSKGIDPSTHKLVQQKQCSPPLPSVLSNGAVFSVANVDRMNIEETTNYKCPDLNLDLTIRSSPSSSNTTCDHVSTRFVATPIATSDEEMEKKEKTLAICFLCRLGFQNNKDCKCNILSINNNDKKSEVDFMNLNMGLILDCRDNNIGSM